MIDELKIAGAGLVDATWWTDAAWPVIWILLGIVAVVVPLMLAIAYLTLWERKFLAGCRCVPALTVWVPGVCCSLSLTA